MRKITLGPLDTNVAETIAKRRGISVDDLITYLLHREAAIELTGWDRPTKDDIEKEVVELRRNGSDN